MKLSSKSVSGMTGRGFRAANLSSYADALFSNALVLQKDLVSHGDRNNISRVKSAIVATMISVVVICLSIPIPIRQIFKFIFKSVVRRFQ
jgi:hypothetical protein